MRAVTLDKKGEVIVSENVKPEPGAREVRIRVVMSSLNFADLKQIRSGSKAVLGLDCVGIVEKVGDKVSKVKTGDRVMAFPFTSGHAAFAIATEALVFPISAEIGWEQAAAAPIVTFLSYFLTQKIHKLLPEDTMIVHAASGGVGTTIIQLAKNLGVQTIIGTVGNLSKADAVYKAGATHVFTYNAFKEETLHVTNNVGVSVVFDSVAGQVTQDSLDVLARFGTLIQFGNASGQRSVFTNVDVHKSCRTIKGFSFGTTRKYRPNVVEEIAADVLNLLEKRELVLATDKTFLLADAQEAYAYVKSRHHTGKVLLKISELGK
ncbi:zinc-binding dehydrogenase [Alkalihalobacillus sp. LMS6]|uniref:quinone oxidoreductase family protein n=2 Tax=Bacillaceae TaxID=186817 RepID=UPI0020D11B70|nr:zinc-binding dehydrogenase [Alkalihalobacillus sp. LMS6]UTR07737.1 zinc-binding dehydrogenase [Alkalihalobacillus sp. LMS6]